MNEEKVQFNLTIPEANLIFKALGRMPFVEVYELIGKLNEQANQQFSNADQNPDQNPNQAQINF